MPKILKYPVVIAALVILGLLLTVVHGCGVEPDRLYAMKLDAPPTEGDWEKALTLTLSATGGATSLAAEGEVDKDSVHKATASCHHGTGATPVKIRAKAYYTPERLFLRISWSDPTEDLGYAWTRSGGRWKAGSPRRDGLGILWGEPGRDFSCMRSCHLGDWRKAGGRTFADYTMAAPEGSVQDLWVWRAGRQAPGGSVEDANLTPAGRKGDGEGVFETPNSTIAAAEGQKSERLFGETDSPARTYGSPPGDWAPGFLVAATAPGRLEVEGAATRSDGLWTLTLSRRLMAFEQGDVPFRPGGEYHFGLAILDGVDRDHNAVGKAVGLKLIEPNKYAVGE